MRLNRRDSCYYKIIEDKLRQVKPVDSIIDILTILSKQEIDSKFMFSDSAYCSLINSGTMDGVGARPKNGEDAYFSKLDSLSNHLISQRDVFINCWVGIDRQGNVINVEITNFNCNKELALKITEFFKIQQWTPAVLSGENVAYRFKEEVFIKGK